MPPQAAGAPRGLHAFPTRLAADLTSLLEAAVIWFAFPASASLSPACESLISLSHRDTSTQVAKLSEISDSQAGLRSEEHTSELQSHHAIVCRLLLENKNDRRTCTN